VGDLVFIGDAHLDDDDPDLPAFLELLDDLASSASRLVFLGDLFNLWIGRAELARPHQTAVARRLRELRAAGVVVRYIEGNRDYRIGECFAGDVFDDVSSGGIEERFGGRRIWAIHGDLANAADRQYRAWRRLSRTSLAWALFNLVPRGRRLRLAESAEARMRASNKAFKRAFPEEVVRAYGRSFVREPGDIVVLGHFHVEKDLRTKPPGPEGRILVLPEWRASRRHLRVTRGGDVSFIDS
jgi:UDP-2,3-diacylglucosamine hydrolase